jgi:hypothetical protein
MKVFIAVVALASLASGDLSPDLLNKINLFNLRQSCWGEAVASGFGLQLHNAAVKCGALPATLDHDVRRRRDAMNYELHSDADQAAYADHMETELDAAVCALKEINWLNEAGELDPSLFSIPALAIYKETPAGSDPVWLNKFSQAMEQCYNIAMAWPASALKGSPLLAKHGRKMIFFKCQRKAEIDTCAKFEMAGYVEASSGQPLDPAKYGVKDKYDAAAMAVRIATRTQSDVAKHMDRFFWGTPETMFH